MTKDELLKLVTALQAELEATNRQVEILSDALAESRREVAAMIALVRAEQRDIDAQIADDLTKHSFLGRVGEAIRANKENA